ncbi:alpha/beta fold hydrolase [Aureispira anguillae]|uniref:T9SS type A sorting domain-containing protein n=1 Tax=Aureispira anguillae TaxID=2864201 RepID=A0A915YKX7_9BACT|nr:alpha/beta fold hydrolase [Aureispira anguillae]BDS15125.1 T9SS type A sorting domain-containing protein [Aureispira anguillae]
MYLPKILLSFWICCTVLASTLNAQNYTTYQLPPPQSLSPLFVGPITGSGIYYGASPHAVDPNKPVIVYVHGFIDLNNLWFAPGNNMYKNTYDAEQNCAFVAMTRGQGMWQNGELLADMLDDITQHFGVNNVVIVAHSNGGKASEVAMITHNRRHKVDRVISLGTPFYGTELANLAEMPGFSWVVNLIGLGGGTSTSTTYYMGGYARPILDWSFRNQPQKFINFGAWGYNNGATILRPVMTTSGALLNWMGSGAAAGGNDGVTPYWSSSRRRGKVQWTTGYGNPASQIDHVDIALSSIMWDKIEPLFTAPLSSLRRSTAPLAAPHLDHSTISSNLQFLSSEDDNRFFIVEKDIRGLEMTILHNATMDQFELKKVADNGDLMPVNIDLNALHQTSTLINGKASLISLHQLKAGKYKLVSNHPFAAIVNSPQGVEIEYDNEHQFALGATPTFKVKINRAAAYDLSQMTLKAIVTLKNDLNGKALENEVTSIETFKLDQTGAYTLNLPQSLPNGVYNMVIQAQHPDFQKSLVTGFVVNKKNNTASNHGVASTLHSITVFPNPVQDLLQVSFENKQAAQITLYDVNGRLIQQQNIQEIGQHQLEIDLNSLKLGQGTYFIEVQDGEDKMIQTFVKLP